MSVNDSLLINRLPIGPCRLTHLYLLSGDDLPTCKYCGVSLTVKHVLLNFSNLRQKTREKYYAVSSLRELLESIDNHTVIDFIKEIHFYCKL